MIRDAMRLRSIKSLTIQGAMVWAVSLRVVLGQNPLPAAAQSARSSPPMPPPPAQSGIAYFRELLEAKPDQREKLLEGKTPQHRAVLENGLRKYEALSPEERELRLRTMELRYHVTSLLRVAPSNRVERLKLVPEKDRLLVEDRLKYWDRLSPADQKDALENERVTRVVLGITVPPTPFRQIPLSSQTSNQVRQIEQHLVRWQSLPDARREQIQKHFQTLFELSDAEKARERLQPLPLTPEERDLMEKTLAEFKKLPVSARSMCISNFTKFADLSPDERRQFLLNAQEWQKMTPEDRQTWRRLVSKVPRMPPLPPGLGQPPLPPRVRPASPATAQVTNR